MVLGRILHTSNVLPAMGPKSQFYIQPDAVGVAVGTAHPSAPTADRDVLVSQTLAMAKLKVRRIEVTGSLGSGVYAKDEDTKRQFLKFTTGCGKCPVGGLGALPFKVLPVTILPNGIVACNEAS